MIHHLKTWSEPVNSLNSVSQMWYCVKWNNMSCYTRMKEGLFVVKNRIFKNNHSCIWMIVCCTRISILSFLSLLCVLLGSVGSCKNCMVKCNWTTFSVINWCMCKKEFWTVIYFSLTGLGDVCALCTGVLCCSAAPCCLNFIAPLNKGSLVELHTAVCHSCWCPQFKVSFSICTCSTRFRQQSDGSVTPISCKGLLHF